MNMSEKTTTRADIADALYGEIGLSRSESADLLESVISEITKSLVKGETVKISSFGSFSIRNKKQRIGRNPKTGEDAPISPRRVLTFRPSNILKDRVNGISV